MALFYNSMSTKSSILRVFFIKPYYIGLRKARLSQSPSSFIVLCAIPYWQAYDQSLVQQCSQAHQYFHQAVCVWIDEQRIEHRDSQYIPHICLRDERASNATYLEWKDGHISNNQILSSIDMTWAIYHSTIRIRFHRVGPKPMMRMDIMLEDPI